MAIRQINVERFSLTSSKPFEEVVRAVDAGIGKPVEPTPQFRGRPPCHQLDQIVADIAITRLAERPAPELGSGSANSAIARP